ncbi:MAG: AraC family transcriptional regulator [Bacteroidota bacterium]
MTPITSLPARVTHRERENETNRMVYSRYQHLEAATICDAYSLKYVSKGEEIYTVNGRRELIGPEQFLLVNHAQEVTVSIHDEETVEGLCVFLSKELMDEVYRTLHMAAEAVLSSPESGNAQFPGSFACRYFVRQSVLGKHLQQLSQHHKKHHKDAFIEDKGSLYQIAELLCEQQRVVKKQMLQLQARKVSTREELYRRLTIALEYMHDNWYLPPKMPEVAREAALSEYHFYRLFRKAYGQSPQQYLLALRLEKSVELLAKPSYSITEVAEACGFYDVHHFNKAFRKRFGEKPSNMRKG